MRDRRPAGSGERTAVFERGERTAEFESGERTTVFERDEVRAGVERGTGGKRWTGRV
jgi:hypothetical protein